MMLFLQLSLQSTHYLLSPPCDQTSFSSLIERNPSIYLKKKKKKIGSPRAPARDATRRPRTGVLKIENSALVL